jgi:hypothetical protein
MKKPQLNLFLPRGRTSIVMLYLSFACAASVLFCSPMDHVLPTAEAQRNCTTPPNPFELVAQQFSKNAPPTDVNGFLLNPQWGWQVNCPVQSEPTLENFPDSIDPRMCKKYDFSDCTGSNKQTSFDPVGFCPMCNLGRRRENRELGHVNWFPVTYTGDICFHNTSYPDMDYTFSLRPKMRAGLTRWNHPSKPDRNGKPQNPAVLPQAIHVEFDSRETVIFFRSKLWSQFRDHASPCRWWDFRNSCNKAEAMKMISVKRAVVFGLMGLDSEHDIYSELHPVYAIAIEINPDHRDNTWILFARNIGNEGNCSSLDHPLTRSPQDNTLLESIKLLIPPPPGSKVNDVSAGETQFFSNNGTCPELGYYKDENYSEDNEGVLVTFDLQACGDECHPIVEGEIHLNWTLQPQVTAEAAEPEDKCLSFEDEEEKEKYKDPTPNQAVQLLQLLKDERTRGARTMNACAQLRGVTIPKMSVTSPLMSRPAPRIPIREAMPGVKNERIKKNYKKVSDIIFP